MDEGALSSALSGNLGFSYRCLAEYAGRPTFVDDDLSIADPRVPFDFTPNNVTVLRPGLRSAAIVSRADEVFGDRRYRVWSLWPLDLAALGFVRFGIPAMIRDPRPLSSPQVEIEIDEVRDAKSAAAYEQTLAAGVGKGAQELAGLISPSAAGDARLRFWLGSVDGRPVATSWSAISDGYVGIYGVATLPEIRRHGYGEALTRAAIMAAPDLPAVLQSSKMGRPLYERMGFREVARFEVWRPG